MYPPAMVVVLALLIAASGVAAMTRGWVLPTHRRPVRRTRLYGCGQLVVAVALSCQAVFGLMTDNLDARRWGTLTGSLLMVAGIVVIGVSRRSAGRRHGTETP